MSLLKRHKGEPDGAEELDITMRTRAGEVYVAAVSDFFAMETKTESPKAPVATPLGALFQKAAAAAAGVSTSLPPAESTLSPALKSRGSPKPRLSKEAKDPPPVELPPSKDPAPAVAPSKDPAPAVDKRGARTVEQTYQKKTQLEHILLRPDSYVGSIERQQMDHWVFDEATGKMVRQKLDYVPALYKIFDEILVNAADNLVRSPNQDTIRVEIDAKNGWVSVHNNGAGVPVQLHKEHGCYVPELIFGHLLTSDNYDDDERKVTGGRNGYGAKLTNIFSKKFKVETADSVSGKSYSQLWEGNMGKRHDPEISPISGEDFTRVTFYPDFARFGMESFDKDIVALMSRRAYDVAAATHGKCKVSLNGKDLSIKSFEDFMLLHMEPDAFHVCEVINERWEVGVALVPDGGGFQQVSFVNSISTCRGGTHVNYVADQLINPIMDKMAKAKGGLAVKSQHVRGYLMVFVNCLIENPAFDSQTKETLTSKKEKFGSTCKLPEPLVTSVMESGILQALQEWSKAMGQSELAQYLNRSDMGLQKKLFGIPKLEDANKAGTKDGGECTLILTEGDSAKALAVAGLSVIGRDLYGVFPLRGKLRNVRDLTVKQMLENKEIDQMMRIVALDASKSYDCVKGLRYGSIMIMTDQDPDGSHIKGLIINFLHYWFPSLLRIPGFLKEFVTPIVKVTKGDEVLTFFTIPEYENWKKVNDEGKGWKCKYYKGLGTSTSTEAREYFAALEDHEIIFTHEGAEDDDLIDMSFNHSRADDRKTWISRCLPDTYVDHTQATISYNEFVNKELVLFAKYDVERMIPSVVDGLKPGQRKVLFGSFKKHISSDIKVSQFSGYVAEHSSYHHGETSLQGTIIGMAQNHVGSNNINLLVPSGQFGTRLAGGKDHAAPRYIFTRLSKATRCLFPEEDDAVLEYQLDEGQQIEPKYYCPIIPLVAANGADGIGVGWSCFVPNYNPRELINNVRKILREETMDKLSPWYRGFKGTISEVPDTNKYECCGIAQKRGRCRLEITELPVRRWTQDYKEWLLEQLPKGDNEGKRAQITDVREYHTENSVHFVLGLTPDKLAEADRRGLQKVFHLKSSISTNNMMLFDPNGKIKKYETLEDICKDHAKVRLELYGKRKAHMLEKLKRQMDLIDNKLRFIQLVVSETLEVDGRKAQNLCNDMRKHGLKHKRDIDGWTEGPQQLSLQEEMGALGYKYLVGMKLWTLTEDRLQELKRQHQEKALEIEKLEGTSVATMWERDLVKLEHALDKIDEEDAKEAEAAAKLAKKHMGADMEGLVNRQCVLVLTQDFKAKRIKTSEWKAQRKGQGLKKGVGDAKAKVKKGEEEEEKEEVEEDEGETLRDVFCCHDFDALLVFTEEGNVFSLQALDVPAAKTVRSKSTSIKEFMPDLGDEKICSMVTIPQKALRDQNDEFVVLVSSDGLAKKVSVNSFRALETTKQRGKGVVCFKLIDGDKLKWALRGSENDALVMVTEKGFVLRSSMGPDWPAAGARSGGRKAMRLKQVAGGVAACCVCELTKQELAQAEENKAKHAEKMALAKEAREKAVAEGGGAADVAMDAPEAAKAKAKKGADDDDSDNDVAGADDAGADDAQDDAQDEEEDGGEDEADADMKDAEEGDKPTQASGAEGATQATDAGGADDAPKSDWGTCLLMVSENGWGMRVPFTHKRLTMGKRGRTGVRVMRVMNNDDVVGAVVVGGKVDLKPPAVSRRAQAIWYAENKPAIELELAGLTDEQRLEMQQETRKIQEEADEKEKEAMKEAEAKLKGAEAKEADDQKEPEDEEKEPEGEAEDKDAGAPGLMPIGFFAAMLGKRRYLELPQSEAQAFEKKAEAEREDHERLMEEYKKEVPVSEEVMVASRGGFISRVMVNSVPVIEKKGVAKGIRVVKIKGKDYLSSISMLSAADDVVDENAVAEAAASAAAAAAVATAMEVEPLEESSPMEEAEEEAVPQAQSPKKLMPKRALPSTPPTNRKASHSDGLAAAAMLDTPMESPGRRIRGKRPASDVGVSPSVDDRSVARPSLARQSSDTASAQSRGAGGRGRGRGVASVRKALGKRTLGTLRLTQPSFEE